MIGGFYEEVQAASANTERKQALLIMKGKLNELKTITDSIAHPILLKRLAILKHDLISLLDTLKFSPSMKVSEMFHMLWQFKFWSLIILLLSATVG